MATLTINEGETRSYSVRLTKQPHVNADDDWWVMIVVDGHRRSVEYYPDKENPIVSWYHRSAEHSTGTTGANGKTSE